MDKENNNENVKEQERVRRRLEDIERDLRRMQKEWITMYEEVTRYLHND